MAKERKLKVTWDAVAETMTIADIRASSKQKDGSSPTTTLNIKALPNEMKVHGMYHGLKQRFSDCTAGSTNPADDFIADISEIYAAMMEKNWNVRVGRGGGGSRVTDLVEALCNIGAAKAKKAGKPEPDLKALAQRVTDASKEQKAKWRENGEVKLEILRLQEERAHAKKMALQKAVKDAPAEPTLDELFAA
jgi:hypothetical protein